MARFGRRRRVLTRGVGTALLGLIVAGTTGGCDRAHYRERADRQVYAIQAQRQFDPRWTLPARPVEADPRSRMADPFDPNREPIPIDDPAARRFQLTAGRKKEYHGWIKRGFAPIETDAYLETLPRDEDGRVVLDRQESIRLALIHSREYQTAVENLYLAALGLTLTRFQFEVQPFFNSGLLYRQFGAGETDSNQLITTTGAGFSQQFFSGAQLLVDFANTLVFEYNGEGFNTATSGLIVSLTQPLLRGAFARIVTQPLSEAERGVLFAVRDFAQFRRDFYVDVVSSYLGLLAQLQAIRNNEEILDVLTRQLEEYQAVVLTGRISQTELDQVVQSVQEAEFTLVESRANLETTLDGYRIQLGFPPDLPVRVDEGLLELFELNDEALLALGAENDALYLDLLDRRRSFEEDAPGAPLPLAFLREAGTAIGASYERLQASRDRVRNELSQWRASLGEETLPEDQEAPEPFIVGDRADQVAQSERLVESVNVVTMRIAQAIAELDGLSDELEDDGLDAAARQQIWEALRDLSVPEFRALQAELGVAQNQARIYLIRVNSVDLDLDEALSLALANRQDLMNARGAVTDRWRDVEVTANALRGDLDVNYTGNLATDPDFDQIFRFDASNSSHSVSIDYDSPLVRRAERNIYRAAQIAFQRARRDYMAVRDQIRLQIRADLRQLELSRQQFAISRAQLITTARQIEEIEFRRNTETNPDASQTLFLLDALQNRLAAQNALIGNWVSYETARLALYRDLDLMDIDAQGVWTNERDDLDQFPRADYRSPDRGGASAVVDESGDPDRLPIPVDGPEALDEPGLLPDDLEIPRPPEPLLPGADPVQVP